MQVLSSIEKLRKNFSEENQSRQVIYEIASILESYSDTGNTYAVIRTKGTSKTFQKSIKELYQKEWISNFSTEDAAHIAFIYALEESGKIDLLKQFPIKKQKVTKSVILLSIFFVTFLILSNLTAFKIAEIQISSFLGFNLKNKFIIDFPAALILFPLTYFFDDILTEVYGFKMSRLIIWGGLFANSIFILIAWLTVFLPPSPAWNLASHQGQEAYSLVFNSSWRIFLASALGYFLGEFLNSTILSKLKILTSGKFFIIRVLGSSIIGIAVDSIVFCFVAFLFTLPLSLILHLILVQYCFKLSYVLIILPITYLLSAALKKIDQVDYYDFETKFNPFSISLEI